jgi:TolB-like protein
MSTFFNELKRRNVFKVAVTYAIVSWIALQVADTVFPALNVPPWVLSLLTVLLLIGFPIALLLSWAFEFTPDGIKPTAEVAPEHSIRSKAGQRLNYLLTGALAVLLTIVVVDSYVLDDAGPPAVATTPDGAPTSSTTPSAAPEKSIAVLPFVNLSSDQEQEYFSDGLSEEILNQLAQIDDLRVTARTSSFSFKGRNEDLRVVGRELNVRHLLEGSVRKAGNQLRITAQLIDAADGSHVWSRSYDRELNDVFAIQEEIAMAVSDSLSVALDVGAMARTRGGTTNLEAYDKYLRARALDRQRGSSDDLVRAAQYYREAVALDPGFVRAWSDLYLELSSWLIYVPDRVAEARKEQEAIHARLRELAPTSPFTITIEASQLLDAHRWADAERTLAAALAAGADFRQDITSVDTVFYLNTGRLAEATARTRRRWETDPLSINASYAWQIMMLLNGRHEEADAEYVRSQSLPGQRGLVEAFTVLRMLARATEPAALRAQLETAARGDALIRLFNDALADQLEDREAALTTLRRMSTDPAMQTANTMQWLTAFADYFDDTDLALSAMRRLYVDYAATNVGMMWRPYRNALLADPRFRDILRDLGLVDYYRASGNWGDHCQPVAGTDDFECR